MRSGRQSAAIRELLPLIALYGVLSAVFCAPLFVLPQGLGIEDWDVHLFYHGAVLKNLLEYGQLPFWNPWYCGGNVMWQNPQVALLSPVYPLSLIVSLALAMKINIVLHYWIGLVGMHVLLTRGIGLSFTALVVFLAAVFAFSGAPALHLAAGHSDFLPAFYLPLQLFFFLRALKTRAVRDACLAGAALALFIYNGGLHIVPMSLISIGALSIVASIAQRRWRPVVLAILVGAAGLAYAAPKLVPIVSFVTSDRFWDARPLTKERDAMSDEMLLRAYLDGYQYRNLHFPLQRSGWHEYGNYIGLLGALLIASSIVWVFMDRGSPEWWLGVSLAVTSILLLVFSAGQFSPVAPASLITHLPFFSQFRIPSRYTIVFVLFGTVTAAWVARDFELAGAFAGTGRRFITIVCVLASIDLVVRNQTQLEAVFSVPAATSGFRWLQRAPTLVTDASSNAYAKNSPMFTTLLAGRSFYNCYEPLQLVHTADADHSLIFTDGNSTMFGTTFTPNRVEFAVLGGAQPSRILLNQNFAPGWHSTLGQVTRDPASGKPSVLLPPKEAGKFSFWFVPPGLIAGLVVFLLAVALSVAAWRKRLPA